MKLFESALKISVNRNVDHFKLKIQNFVVYVVFNKFREVTRVLIQILY
jgi:hypothetical protein